MPLRARDIAPGRRRATPGIARRTGWLALGLAGVGAGFGLIAATVGPLPIGPSARLTGTLRDLAEPETLSLPPGITIAGLVAEPGMQVTQGDVLATLDPLAMAARLTQTEAALAADAALAACLDDLAQTMAPASTAPGAVPPPQPTAPPPQPALMQNPVALFSAVMAERPAPHGCTPEIAELAETLRRIDTEVAAINRRIDLLSWRIDLELAQGQPPSQDALHLVLDLSWARSADIARREGFAQQRFERARALAYQVKTETRNLRDRMAAADIMAGDLRTYLAEPRLITTDDVIVRWANRSAVGRPLDKVTDVLQVMPVGAERFQITLTAPAVHRGDLLEGTEVRLQIDGGNPRLPVLRGQVTRLEPAADCNCDPAVVQAEIRLLPESVAALVALRGPVLAEDQVTVQLLQSSETLLQKMHATVQRLVPPAACIPAQAAPMPDAADSPQAEPDCRI